MEITLNRVDNLQHLRSKIDATLTKLYSHPVYNKLESMNQVKTFMKYHSFAVWDFMSLVKALQRFYAPSSVPWFSPEHTEISRFINEIVLGEESDIDADGNYNSHFNMYLDAMDEIDADTEPIRSFIDLAKKGDTFQIALKNSNLPNELKSFLSFTFETIQSGEIHKIASAFTFGREDIIPEMFMRVLENSKEIRDARKFKYYLDRHIEVDGDHHGPMSLQLIKTACGSDETKWKDAIVIAEKAIEKRIDLWSFIENKL